jgi:hypothetical protein
MQFVFDAAEMKTEKPTTPTHTEFGGRNTTDACRQQMSEFMYQHGDGEAGDVCEKHD